MSTQGSSTVMPEVMRYQPPILESELLDGFSLRYLKLSGMWATIDHQRTTGKKSLLLKLIFIGTLLEVAPYISFQLIAYFVIAIDIQKATFLSLDLLLLFQVLCKQFVFWFSNESICWLYDLVRKDFLTIPEDRRPEVEKIYRKISKKTKKTMMIISVVYTCAAATGIVRPAVPVDYIAHRTGSMAAVAGGRKKIRGGWYPVPMDKSPYYELIYVYEAVGRIWHAVLVNIYLCFFYQLLMCLYAQFAVLKYLLSTLYAEAKRTNNVDHPSSYKKMNKELHVILQEHQKLIRYSNKLKKVYNPMISVILGIGIFVLVTSELHFLFAGTRSRRFLIRSAIYVAFQTVEVCMFCYCSSSLEAVSSDLHFAIYSSDWYKADVNFRRSAQMLMLRARKGVTLTAIKMYPVNMETIMAVFQFTYSSTTLLSRFSD